MNDLVVEPPHEAGLRVSLRSTQDLLGNLVLHNFHHLDSDVMKIFVFVDILGIIVFSLILIEVFFQLLRVDCLNCDVRVQRQRDVALGKYHD